MGDCDTGVRTPRRGAYAPGDVSPLKKLPLQVEKTRLVSSFSESVFCSRGMIRKPDSVSIHDTHVNVQQTQQYKTVHTLGE